MLSIMYIGSAVAIAALNAFNSQYLHTLIHIWAISACTHIHICNMYVGLAVAIAALNAFITQYLYTHTHIFLQYLHTRICIFVMYVE